MQDQLPENIFKACLSCIPANFQKTNARFVRWQDRQAHVLGKLLVRHVLTQHGYTKEVLSQIEYNLHGRPYVVGSIDFNLSHSGQYIVCAAGKGIRLGIDVEEIRSVDLSAFEDVMTREQWQEITSSQNCLRTFYELWTLKESVVKADSRGLTIPLKDIVSDKGIVALAEQRWYTRRLELDGQYAGCLATDNESYDLVIEELLMPALNPAWCGN